MVLSRLDTFDLSHHGLRAFKKLVLDLYTQAIRFSHLFSFDDACCIRSP